MEIREILVPSAHVTFDIGEGDYIIPLPPRVPRAFPAEIPAFYTVDGDPKGTLRCNRSGITARFLILNDRERNAVGAFAPRTDQGVRRRA